MRKGFIPQIERGLLGVSTRSFATRARDAGWEPEPLSAACWRCGSGVGAHEVDGEGCASCRGERVAWDRAVRLGSYNETLIHDAVVELKYAGWRRSGNELGAALGFQLGRALDEAGVERGACVLVPVPMPWTRRVARGVDHTLVLARGAAGVLGCPVGSVLAARQHRRQVGLGATARAANIRGGFRCAAGPARLRRVLGGARVVVLIDDVMTTGSTLDQAARTLRGALERGSGGDQGGALGLWVAVTGVSGGPGRREAAGAARPEIVVRAGAQIPQEVCPPSLTRRG